MFDLKTSYGTIFMKRNIKTKFKGFRGCQIKAINESDNVAPKVFFRNLYGFKNIKTKELI